MDLKVVKSQQKSTLANNNLLPNSYDSKDLNEISVEYRRTSSMGLKYLPNWPPVDIEFHDINFSVPDLTTGNKVILRGINGLFRSHELTAIMGPSGSGKTTLLNTLAGYKSTQATGQINVNGQPRQMQIFRKMSRYIMQNEILDPLFTVHEAMMLAAHLKLGNKISKQQKYEIIDEILEMLRLQRSRNTRGSLLSGGEKKRLSIALELVNNPPVIFLDEPTTGLDDLSSSQCISLLRRVAHMGRTIICSIHTPSAKLFQMFDKVYILADGQCVYQGSGNDIVPYIKSIGLTCPLTYNPADFIIEVAAREYGLEYHEPMVTAVDNGNCFMWKPNQHLKDNFDDYEIQHFEEDINPKLLNYGASWWLQFQVLLQRMMKQMWRDKSYIKLKFFMTIGLGLIVGGLYIGIGNDATKSLFNFGFVVTIVIAYLYLPLMPVLLQFPTEMRLLKREYFNQWYSLSAYFCALMISKIPIMLMLVSIYMTMIYFMSSQPLEWSRYGMAYLIALLIGMTSDSFGILISSRLNVVNSMFVGPVLAVPLILMAVYGFGFGKEIYLPPIMRFIRSLSYLRHGLEGLIAALYGFNRSDSICPITQRFCMFKKHKFLLTLLGFEDVNYLFSVSCLLAFYITFTALAYLLVKQRLSFTTSKYAAVQYIGQFVKTHLNFSGH